MNLCIILNHFIEIPAPTTIMTTELYSNRSNGENFISILGSIKRTRKKKLLFQLFIVPPISKYNNFKFIHSFIAGKRPHRKPDTQILGDYGVEEWRDGGML